MAKQFSKAFYNSSAWKWKRREVLHRDAYTCNDCGGRADEVHHIIELTPENIGDARIALGNDNLMSLCSACHKKRTLGSAEVPSGFYFDERGYVVPATYPPGEAARKNELKDRSLPIGGAGSRARRGV